MNLGNRADGFKFLIRNRDAKFNAVLAAAGVRISRAPVQARRANAIADAGSPVPVASAWIGC